MESGLSAQTRPRFTPTLRWETFRVLKPPTDWQTVVRFTFSRETPKRRNTCSILASGGESAPFHFKPRRAGSAIWVDAQGTPIKNVEGEFIGIVGTFRVSEMQK